MLRIIARWPRPSGAASPPLWAVATPRSRARYVSFVQEVPRLAWYPGAVNLIGVLMFVTVTSRFGVIEDLLGAINLCSARFFPLQSRVYMSFWYDRR